MIPEHPTKVGNPLLVTVLATVLLLTACQEKIHPEKPVTVVSNNATLAAEQPGPGPDEKACFVCQAKGTVACRALGCVKGKVDCPSPCLKLSRGAWVHLDMPGHDRSELWQNFPDQRGKGARAWNQNHVGEVIVYQDGVAVNTGPCKLCGGSTKVQCRVCNGSGTASCELCTGKKFIPTAWTPTDNPWFNRQPDIIRLSNGEVILGRIAATSGDDSTIVTRDKKVRHVKSSDILPKSGQN